MLTVLLRRHLVAVLAFSLLGLGPVAASAASAGNVCTPAANQVLGRFTYGSEKEPWIRDVTEAFNQRGEKTASGRVICVQAIPMGSGDSVKQIKQAAGLP